MALIDDMTNSWDPLIGTGSPLEFMKLAELDIGELIENESQSWAKKSFCPPHERGWIEFRDYVHYHHGESICKYFISNVGEGNFK